MGTGGPESDGAGAAGGAVGGTGGGGEGNDGDETTTTTAAAVAAEGGGDDGSEHPQQEEDRANCAFGLLTRRFADLVAARSMQRQYRPPPPSSSSSPAKAETEAAAVDTYEAAAILQVPKQRIDDIADVLVGIGLWERPSKNTVRRRRRQRRGCATRPAQPTRSPLDELHNEMRELNREEASLDRWIALLRNSNNSSGGNDKDNRKNGPRSTNAANNQAQTVEVLASDIVRAASGRCVLPPREVGEERETGRSGRGDPDGDPDGDQDGVPEEDAENDVSATGKGKDQKEELCADANALAADGIVRRPRQALFVLHSPSLRGSVASILRTLPVPSDDPTTRDKPDRKKECEHERTLYVGSRIGLEERIDRPGDDCAGVRNQKRKLKPTSVVPLKSFQSVPGTRSCATGAGRFDTSKKTAATAGSICGNGKLRLYVLSTYLDPKEGEIKLSSTRELLAASTSSAGASSSTSGHTQPSDHHQQQQKQQQQKQKQQQQEASSPLSTAGGDRDGATIRKSAPRPTRSSRAAAAAATSAIAKTLAGTKAPGASPSPARGCVTAETERGRVDDGEDGNKRRKVVSNAPRRDGVSDFFAPA